MSSPAELIARYPGTPTQLAADLAAAGFPAFRQAVSDWKLGKSVPSAAALPHLARVLRVHNVEPADLYAACGVMLPTDLFPGLSRASDR